MDDKHGLACKIELARFRGCPSDVFAGAIERVGADGQPAEARPRPSLPGPLSAPKPYCSWACPRPPRPPRPPHPPRPPRRRMRKQARRGRGRGPGPRAWARATLPPAG